MSDIIRIEEQCAIYARAIMEQSKEIERLRAELDAANKDAARYRWLRGHCESVVGLRLDWFIPQAEDLQWGDGSDTFDAAIDAAIAGETT